MRILLIDDNDPFRHFVVTTLENNLRDVDVVEATTVKVAKMLFDSDPYFEAIMVSLDMTSDSPLSLIHYLQGFNSKLNILTYSENPENTIPHTFPLQKKTGQEDKSPQKFIDQLLKVDCIQKNKKLDQKEIGHAHIKIFYLWRFEELPFDLYVKINEKKYVKILAKNNRYDEAFIEKYHTLDNEYLYLELQDYPLLEKLLYSDHWFEEMSELSEEDMNFRMRKIIHHMAQAMGLTPHLIKKAEEVVNAVLTNIEKNPNLSKLLSRQQKGVSFQTNVSTLITYITSALCDHLKWTTNSSKVKLGFAAIFQDTSLKSSKLSSLFYANLSELDEMELSDQELKIFYNHPYLSAELASEVNLKYPQVEQIIKHHHERPNGSGFPLGINHQKIPALSSLFIVAHDYVMRSIMYRFEKDYTEVLAEMAPYYSVGHFKKCFNALEEVLKAN
jgi:hypothetical protein